MPEQHGHMQKLVAVFLMLYLYIVVNSDNLIRFGTFFINKSYRYIDLNNRGCNPAREVSLKLICCLTGKKDI